MMNSEVPHLGERRLKAWWEPTFNPELQSKLQPCDWKFENSTGPKQAFLSAKSLISSYQTGESISLVNLTFEDCDIQGDFEHSPTIFFEDCRFYGCDFAHSQWKRVTFKNCVFKKCSFALTIFEDCEFRDCSWERMGIQGRKTSFNRTYLTNPAEFIASGFSGIKENDHNPHKSKFHQKYRLEESKAHLSRTLLYSHEAVGDDITFYSTAKLHDIQQIKSKIYKRLYLAIYEPSVKNILYSAFIIANFIEILLLYVLGLANGWGATALRPIGLLAISFLIFSQIYQHLCFHSSCDAHFQKSFDITTIAGYTNQVNIKQSLNLRLVECIQLVISITLYTIFFATVVARSSRSR